MYNPLRIFIGYDPVETEAWHVCAQSIIEHASRPVAITPVNVRNYRAFYHRERDPKQSNEFTYTRFLTPWLCGYEGQALFIDCDMILRTDVYELFEISDQRHAITCVHHDYEPKDKVKYLGAAQYSYPRKNWSSVMLFNCAHPALRALDPFKVAHADPAYLHRFQFLNDAEIGEVGVEWNFLVGEYDLDKWQEAHEGKEVKLVHWTVGGPYFNEYQDTDFADEWFALQKKTRHTEQLVKPTSRKKSKSAS